jgi:hypothetical protein
MVLFVRRRLTSYWKPVTGRSDEIPRIASEKRDRVIPCTVGTPGTFAPAVTGGLDLAQNPLEPIAANIALTTKLRFVEYPVVRMADDRAQHAARFEGQSLVA